MRVYSEIGPLKKVLLHRPGRELEHLVPEEMERLLFDDIPYLKTARAEHDFFADVLRKEGAEPVYLEDLMAETLAARPEIKDSLILQFISEAGSNAQGFRDDLREYLLQLSDPKELVLKLMSGISAGELGIRGRQPLAEKVFLGNRFLLDPLPNLYFTRDPFAVIGSSTSLNHMFSGTRRRETIFGEYILKYHPELSAGCRLCYHRNLPYHIEGGDILVLSGKVVTVGISQRTTPEAIEVLAKNLFLDKAGSVDRILALDIPNLRAYMHLDTVLTQVDTDKFLVHPGILRDLRAYEITKGTGAETLSVNELKEGLAEILASRLGLDKVSLIKCGGGDRISSEREQWNDGSNTLCIRPGVVIAYDRNQITNRILREQGIEVLEIPSSELSRGRGGPRCMSMPLEREDL